MKKRCQIRPHRAFSAALIAALAFPCLAASQAASRNPSPSKPNPGSKSQKPTGSAFKPAPPQSVPTKPAQVLSQAQKVLHALNRLGFGANLVDVEYVRRTGLEKWIAQQLQPASIDDSLVEQKISRLRTLEYSSQQLALAFAADSLFRRQMVIDRRNRAVQNSTMQNGAMGDGAMSDASDQAPGTVPAPAQRLAADIREMTPQQQRIMEEARLQGMSNGIAAQVVGELVTAKLILAVESRRQLHEVMVDFWSNHFNVDVKKGPVRTYKVADERDVIRPHVWGKFRDFLGASAKSPAMLFYLDNARSTRPMEIGRLATGTRNGLWARANRGSTPQGTAPGEAMMSSVAADGTDDDEPTTRGGINENYARELMELHTLGVNGGYTQKDVQEVARCFTGWSINRQTGAFQFKRYAHDNGGKVVLGQRIAAGGGIQDGERVLDILATHPSTARFLARKLSMRLVSDQPPAALVERAAQAFLRSDGDLRVLVESIVRSKEFWSASSYRSKIKSPFEYAVSALRAVGGTINVPDATRLMGRMTLISIGSVSVNPNAGGMRGGRGRRSLAHEIATMGQPLYSYQAPTGYPEKSQNWVSAGALVSRLNFALNLTGGRVTNTRLVPQASISEIGIDSREATLERLLHQLVGGEVSPATRQTLQKAVAADSPVDMERCTALIFGSPEFQRR